MRPKYERIKQECEQIKALWAKGFDDAQVKQSLKMSNSIYETRLKYIARDRFNTNIEFTLLQYQIKKQRRYDQLEAMLESTKNEDMKLKCIQEMNALDDGFVKMGQRLGVFPEAPKKIAGVFASANIGDSTDISDIRKDFQDIVITKTKQLIKDKYQAEYDNKKVNKGKANEENDN